MVVDSNHVEASAGSGAVGGIVVDVTEPAGLPRGLPHIDLNHRRCITCPLLRSKGAL
jgi:hypothetical protein